MTEKFTQGEWRVRRYKDDPNFDLYDYLVVETVADEPLGIAAMFQRSDIDSEANAALIAAAPEMYRNEENNLEILKIVQDVYTELKHLIKYDSDVKTCFPSLPEDTFDFILKRIKIRIIKTENALKKARGEE